MKGAKLNGRILPGGADWQIVRNDGVADIEARYTIETDTGARILVSSEGLRHGPPEVMERLVRGDSVDPAQYYFRTVMRFETADPAVDWLNRILALARGQREARSVRLDVYEVDEFGCCHHPRKRMIQQPRSWNEPRPAFTGCLACAGHDKGERGGWLKARIWT